MLSGGLGTTRPRREARRSRQRLTQMEPCIAGPLPDRARVDCQQGIGAKNDGKRVPRVLVTMGGNQGKNLGNP